MKKLVKKQTGGSTSSKATPSKSDTVAKKKVIMDVSRNPQYKSSGMLDTSGKMVYQRKKGSGPSRVTEGTSAAANFKKGGQTKSKKK